MVESIKKIFIGIGIENYKIVKHSSVQELYDLTESLNTTRKEISSYIILFRVGSHLYKMEFSGTVQVLLKESILDMVRNNLWYCGEEDEFDKPGEHMISSGQLTNFINPESLQAIKDKYPLCKRIYCCNSRLKTECFMLEKQYVCEKSDTVISVWAEMIKGFPAKEITIRNPQCVDEVVIELDKQSRILSDIAKCKNAANAGIEQTCGKILLSSDISKMLVLLLCYSLHGEQVIFGASFISAKDFALSIFQRPLSIYRENDGKIDAEGFLRRRKYYIRDGVLLSAFNDIKTASYLHQTAGDTEFNAEKLCTTIDFDKIVMAPCCTIIDKETPMYDLIAGNQFLYNQVTGELSLDLLATALGSHVCINDHIVNLFNKVECAYTPESSASSMSDNYCLLINLEA